MRRKITVFIIIFICFILQTTVFQKLSIAGIAPNLMIIVVASFGLMRGQREGLIIGFICGLIIDLFFGKYLGIYSIIYMYLGYLNGKFQKNYYPDDIKLPLLLISVSDVVYNLLVYIFLFLFRARFQFFYYLKTIILPELIYTLVITILLYFILLKVNQWLEEREKRSTKKLDL